MSRVSSEYLAAHVRNSSPHATRTRNAVRTGISRLRKLYGSDVATEQTHQKDGSILLQAYRLVSPDSDEIALVGEITVKP